jgi:hypothetical protein
VSAGKDKVGGPGQGPISWSYYIYIDYVIHGDRMGK